MPPSRPPLPPSRSRPAAGAAPGGPGPAAALTRGPSPGTALRSPPAPAPSTASRFPLSRLGPSRASSGAGASRSRSSTRDKFPGPGTLSGRGHQGRARHGSGPREVAGRLRRRSPGPARSPRGPHPPPAAPHPAAPRPAKSRDRPERGGTSWGRERVVEQAGGGGACRVQGVGREGGRTAGERNATLLPPRGDPPSALPAPRTQEFPRAVRGSSAFCVILGF